MLSERCASISAIDNPAFSHYIDIRTVCEVISVSYFSFENRKIWYSESGEGTPVLFLHGNTASSRMFGGIAERYAANHRVILFDFLGHGSSDRLKTFPADLWFYEAQQVVAFLQQKQYHDVQLIGSSGGALVAINAALEAPDLISRVIADSFEGTRASGAFTANLHNDRRQAKQNEAAREFFQSLHGDDWQQIVDNDTEAVLSHAQTIGEFFHRPLSSLKADILLTGSMQDEYTSVIAPNYYHALFTRMLTEIGHGQMHIFPTGGHPALFSNAEEFFRLSDAFLQ